MAKIVRVKAHTRKAPKKSGTYNKYGIKQNLTSKELADRTALKNKMESLRQKYKNLSGKKDGESMKARFALSDEYDNISKKMYKRYGVTYPGL